MASIRQRKINKLLLSHLAEAIRREHHPGLLLVTLLEVSITPDFKKASILWTLASREGVSDVEELLTAAIPTLKKSISRHLSLKYVPELVFKYDDSVERAERIDYLLKMAES